MARKSSGVSLPSGQGGLIGGVSSSYTSKFTFGPKVVIFAAVAAVIFVLILFNM